MRKGLIFVGSLVSLVPEHWEMVTDHSLNQSMQGEVCIPPERGFLGSSVLTGLVPSIPALQLNLATQRNPKKLPTVSGQHMESTPQNTCSNLLIQSLHPIYSCRLSALSLTSWACLQSKGVTLALLSLHPLLLTRAARPDHFQYQVSPNPRAPFWPGALGNKEAET